MRFGIGLQSHIGRSWKHAVLAEQVGFDDCWLVDSQLIASDVYACMTLAAEHTERITLGTGVTVVDTRIAPVIAHSIATINQMAPGRVVLGIGAGHTAWRTMGIPPASIASFRHAVEVCEGLLAGKSVAFEARGRRSEIHFQDIESGYVNVHDRVPIFLAASHPRAQALAGEIGDGVITISLLDPAVLRANLERVDQGFAVRGGRPDDYAVVTLGISCVLRAGEGLDSDRVKARVGPRIAVALHYAYEQMKQGREVPPFMEAFLTPAYRQYLEERWEVIHTTHSRFLQPGEDAFISPDAIRTMSLTGTRDEIIERLQALETAGMTHFGISPAWDFVEESAVEFGREIAANYRLENASK